MKDLELIKQLYNGNHLSNEELDKAKNVLESLMFSLKRRVRE